MAITDAYATAETYRYVTGKTGISEDAAILIDLTAVSRYIDGKVGRFFSKDASDTTRIISPTSTSPILYIPDLSAAPTSVKIDTNVDGTFGETALAVTEYSLYPLDALVRPEPWPYTSIILNSWGVTGSWPWRGRVQITGKFGWPAVPAAVARATIHLAAILRLESPRATSRISELEGTFEASREAQSIIKGLLDQYQWHFFV